jgi:diguanylate cyclase (GGDEF)-like protein/PAS domain S-box-containing protein
LNDAPGTKSTAASARTERAFGKWTAGRVTAAYLGIALLGMLLLELWLVRNGPVPRSATWRELARDGAFVLASSAAVYWLLKAAFARIARSEREGERTRILQGAAAEVLHHLNRGILRGEPIAGNLETVCGHLVDTFGYDLVWIGQKEPGGELTVRAAAGGASGLLGEVRFRWDEGPAGAGSPGEAMRSGLPSTAVVGEGPLAEPFRRWGIRSSVSFPLLGAEETLGALTACSCDAGTFERDGSGLLRAFADEAALSIAAALHQERLHLQTVALESASNAIAITDARGVIRWVNPAFTALTGFSSAESVGQTPQLLKSGAHGDAFYAALWKTISSGGTWRGEIYNQRKDGSVYIEDQTITPVKDASGAISHYIAIKQDATTRRQQEAELRHLSDHDPVTDLPNRRALLERLERAVLRCRYASSGAFLIVDVDDFRVVIDAVGPLAADSVLLSAASHVAAALRPGDFLAHLGGDEFGILFERTSFEEARQTAERIRERVAATRFTIGERHFDLTLRGGLALIDGSLDAEGVLALANSALLSAKEGGTPIVGHRRPEDRLVHAGAAGQWAARIRDALAAGSFELHYQPVVPFAPGKKAHHEVLLRMKGAGTERIPPASFLPAAERFGLMPRIDEWVIGRSLDLLERHSGLELFVNLSGRSLGDQTLFAKVEARLRADRATAERLTFEITETSAISDLIATQRWIRRMKELGCSFAIDDFGIGFSSLSYLRALAVDYVKIDGSFIRGLDTDLTNRALVEAVRNVAHILGKEVIAECVETEAVSRTLAGMGIEYGQGFFWGPPSAEVPGGADRSGAA